MSSCEVRRCVLDDEPGGVRQLAVGLDPDADQEVVDDDRAAVAELHVHLVAGPADAGDLDPGA